MREAEERSVGITLLRRVKLLEPLSDKQLDTMARCLVSKAYRSGEVIIRQVCGRECV